MKHRAAQVVLAASVALFAGVVVVLRAGSTGPARSDLQGTEVRDHTLSTASDRAPKPAPAGSKTAPAGPGTTVVTSSVNSAPRRSPVTTVVEPAEIPEPGVPTRIAIPALNLDAAIVAVGIKDDGSMEIPGAVEAGWYRFGPRPGAIAGSAVIAGHVDHKKLPGVFLELRRLDLGAEVSVTDDRGDIHRYVVIERFQVGKRDLPVKTLFRRDGDPVLTLITCGGEFDRKARRYDDNIVITAAPVGTRNNTLSTPTDGQAVPMAEAADPTNKPGVLEFVSLRE